MPALVFSTPLLLPAFLHAITLIVFLPFSCTVVLFPSSYHVLYRIGGAEIKDASATNLSKLFVNSISGLVM